MTIGQFLDKFNNSWSDVRRDIFFQFTDARGVVWKTSYGSENNARCCFGNFPCNIVCRDEKNIVFDLDLNSIPSNLVSTFNEIYDQPAKKSDKQYSEVTVSECLNAYSKLESKPSVYFKQLVHLENELYEGYRWFTTSESVSIDETMNGSFSWFLVNKINENKDGSITVCLETPAEEQYDREEMEEEQEYQRQKERESRMNAIRFAILISVFVGFMLALVLLTAVLTEAVSGAVAQRVALLMAPFIGISLGIISSRLP